MHNRENEIRELALKAVNKRAAIGGDVNLADFVTSATPHKYLAENELSGMSAEDQERLKMAGLDMSGKERGGTYLQVDASVVHCGIKEGEVEIIPMRAALQQDWVWDYYWKLVAPDTDKYTAAAALNLHDGYVVRSKPGSKSIYPLQTGLYIEKEGLQQNVHNIIIAEEDSELHIISGCATAAHLKKGLHVGISEFFVKKNAKLTFTMIHNWAEDMYVRPRSVARVEEGGLFLNNYIAMKPVRSLQMYPTTHLVGENAVSQFYSIIVGNPDTEFDVGGRVYLNHPGNRAEIVSRAITNGGRIIARGDLVGNSKGIKAHLECRGMLLNGGVMHAIPELRGTVDDVEMSHEAAVGKIAQEEITYLMSRGLTEDEATSTIIRGFLNVDMPGLPPELKAEVDAAIQMSDTEGM